MAALSRSSIIRRLREPDDLKISPILDIKQLGASSVDLRMGTVVLLSRAGAESHVDPREYIKVSASPDDHDTLRDEKQKHERFDVRFSKSFLLHPGTLALVPTLERVKLPFDLQGVVTARS